MSVLGSKVTVLNTNLSAAIATPHYKILFCVYLFMVGYVFNYM